jgi:hypothetical protein
MTVWRLILALAALTFIGFGFAFIFNPDEMAAIASITLTAPAARTDVRAMYGGLEFGFGVFLLLCTVRRRFVRIGLFAAACALVSMATARSVGLILDGLGGLQFLIAITEWVGGGLATYGALVTKPEPDALPPPIEDAVSADLDASTTTGQGRKNA